MFKHRASSKIIVAESTITRWWSQTRADYLAENTISCDKPWEKLGIMRRTWYYRGKPMPSETQQEKNNEPLPDYL
ncbi:hypothetical protein B1A90_12075 [Neisseria meningitidis]|nr:hypothetical protein B1A92_11930 [Neisseria meningitidis]OOG95406.1 hypothetical protein B1A91_11895 [Neisseria meningitidis]OOG95408.1 hypothetical protein B1A90_12075 [Neisseria meningitidis]